MLPLIALLLVFAVGVLLISVVMLRFAGALTRRMLTGPFTYAEYITEHHRPPPEWLRTRSLIDKRLNRPPLDAQSVGSMSERQRARTKARLLRRLSRLIRSFGHSAFFESEEARAELLAALEQVRQTWERQSLEEIIRR